MAISDIVLFEISKTRDSRKRQILVDAIARYQIPLQPIQGAEQDAVGYTRQLHILTPLEVISHESE